nr:Chain U, kDa initiator binding protein [Trichomonas vaginalis]
MDSNDLEASFTSRLPPEIVAALKRKSSRDPNSRFPRKLHMLLTYLASNPQLEEEIGLSWISDTEFKMKKKNVALVMGIKLNTLNVNLRDLAFEQLQHDKGGWTQWKRSGFTRNSVFEDPTQNDSPMHHHHH